MDTVFDWISVAIFAGLIVLFLQRATSEHSDKDAPLYYYIGAGVGCAVADYLGNHGQNLLAIILLVATVGFIIWFLRPFQFSAKP